MPSRRGPSRGLLIGIGVAVVVVIGVIVFLASGDDATEAKPETPKDTRPFATGIGIDRTGNPRSGTYRYTTTGQESIDTPPSTVKYPAETTITVSDTDCGYDSLWAIAPGRSELVRKCTQLDPERHRAWAIVSTESTNPLLIPNPSSYTCEGVFDLYTRARIGVTYSGRCTQDTNFTLISYETVDRPTLVVGNLRVRTVHFLIRSNKGGDTTGTTTEDRWVMPGSGLVVRSDVTQTDKVTTATGPATYKAKYRIKLQEVTPS